MQQFNFIYVLFSLLFLTACSGSKKTAQSTSSTSAATGKKIDYPMLDQGTFALPAVTTDKTYGYDQNNPIKVGGTTESSGPLNERRFLNALLGPNGETVTYVRKGSCCAFKSPNGFNGVGLLDRYEVTYDGLETPVILFINMYDYGELKAPVGFTYRK
jgi:hypothetical protein